MSEEMTLREEIIKIIDDTPSVLEADYKKLLDKRWSTIDDDNDVAKPIIKSIAYGFWEEYRPEIAAFCEYWKGQIPPDEVLETLTDDEFEAIIEEFGGETVLLFENAIKRFQEKFKKQIS